MDKIIIFGASNFGQIAYNVLKDKYDICFFSDNDKNKWDKKFCGLKIINPQELVTFNNYKIVIASMYYGEIANQLRKMNLKEIYIFSYCDYNDTTFNKRYSIDKSSDTSFYRYLKVDEEFKTKFVKNFSLIYNKNSNILKQEKALKNSKKVLVISYIFPPIAGGGVQRSLKFVKYLKEYGWNPVVVTVDNDFYPDEKDQTLLNEIPKSTEIIRINHDYFNTEQLNSEISQQIINLLYGIVNEKSMMDEFIERINYNGCSERGLLLTPDIYIGWVNSVLQKIEYLIDMNSIDLVYTTSYPYSAHIVGFYLKNKYNIPWVSDYRDEWTNHSYSSMIYKNDLFKYNFEKHLEKSLVSFADKVITVTPISTENYVKTFNLDSNKVITITNGYDENDFKSIKNIEYNKEKFTIVHLGSIYINRFPEKFIMGINELIYEGEISKELFKIKLIGKIDSDILTLINKLDIYRLIEIINYLPHEKCLIEGTKSSVLVLPIGKEEKFKLVYTGKVFEYLRLYRPILALSPVGSVVDILINETCTGMNFDYDNISGIKKYILNLYNDWLKNKYNLKVNKNNIKKYERKYLTGKLSKIFNDLTK